MSWVGEWLFHNGTPEDIARWRPQVRDRLADECARLGFHPDVDSLRLVVHLLAGGSCACFHCRTGTVGYKVWVR